MAQENYSEVEFDTPHGVVSVQTGQNVTFRYCNDAIERSGTVHRIYAAADGRVMVTVADRVKRGEKEVAAYRQYYKNGMMLI